MNCNVLVRDPDEEFRARLAAALGARAYVVEEGEDGRAILTSTGPVAVLIVEILMPEQDGLEAIRSARARWPSVKVIATTAGRAALSADYLLGLAAHLGADVTLTKDTPLATFLAAVARLMAAKL